MEDVQLGKPEVLDAVDVDFEREDVPVVRKPGRPPGSKNQDTLFKDQMQVQFEKKLRKEFEGVLHSVVKKAKGGDMGAAKLIMDRVVPVSKPIDSDNANSIPAININIGDLALPKARVINDEVEKD